jgi:hypothetical protein
MGDIPLNYALPARRSVRRRLIIAAIALVTGVFGYWLATEVAYPFFRWRLPYLHRQAACLNWIGSPSQPAYEEDPAPVKQLTGGHHSGAEFFTLSNAGDDLAAYCYRPSLVDGLHDPYFSFFFLELGTAQVLLHQRTSRGGAPRLVSVRVSDYFPARPWKALARPAPWRSTLVCMVFQTAGLRQDAKFLKRTDWIDPALGETTSKPTRIFFGQPDPVDESRFSILFQTPTETKLIRGQLLADDTIHFEIVAAPDSMIPKRPTTSETHVASPRN